MLNFVKKFFVFKNKKCDLVTGLIKDDEINLFQMNQQKNF